MVLGGKLSDHCEHQLNLLSNFVLPIHQLHHHKMIIIVIIAIIFIIVIMMMILIIVLMMMMMTTMAVEFKLFMQESIIPLV